MGHSQDIWRFRTISEASLPTSHPKRGLQVSGNKRDCLQPNAQSVACNVAILQGFLFDGSWLSKEFDVERKPENMMSLYHEAICSYLAIWCTTLHCLKRLKRLGRVPKSKSKKQISTISSTLPSSLCRLHEWSIQLDAAKRKSGEVNCSVQLVLFSSWHETPTNTHQD